MDKYEYRVKTEQMLEHMERKRYKKAMEIADTIDWRRVKNPAMLNSVSEIYEFNGEYQKSRDVLFVAYDRAPNSRKTIYRLGTLALRLNDVDEASDCYEEFVKLAPKDPNQYILKYKILKARRAPLADQIDALEEFKKAEYIEKWAYELASLYDQAGMTAECLEECDDLILWFSEGKYVYQAMELKMKYKPLTPLQQEKYNSQKKAYEQPTVEPVEEAEEQQEEAKAEEEAPESAEPEEPEKKAEKEVETSVLKEEPQEISTEDIAAKALAAVAETEKVPMEKAETQTEAPEEKPHKRSSLRQSVKGATLAEALKKGMAVANGENPESKALNESDEALRVTGQMKIDDILQAWEAKQKDNAEAIEIQKKKDEEILAQKKLEAERRREEEARRIEEQQRAAEEARRIAEQKAAEEARRAAARRAEEERILAEQRAEEERRRAIEEAEAEERRLEQEAAEKAKAEAEARRKQEEEEAKAAEEAPEEAETDEDEFEEEEFEEAELEEVEADEDEFEEEEFEEAELEEVEADEDEFEEEEFEEAELEEAEPVEEVEFDETDEIEEVEPEEPEAAEDEFEDEFEDAEYEEAPEEETDDLADLLRELEETDAEKDTADDQGFFDDEFEDEFEEDDVNDDFLDDDLDAEYDDEYEEEPEGEEAYDDDEFEEEEFEEDEFEDEYEDEFEEEEPEPDLSNIDDLTIEEPSEEEIQRRIKKGRGGVPFDTGFVVTGRYDLSATSEIGLRAGLTEEQKQLFSYFVPVRGMSEQIVEVLDNDRRERREGTSRTGNIVVIGHKGSGKTVLAVDIVKAIQKQRNLKQGKVAIVTGESLNKKELGGIIQKLRGGAIIIEKAGQLNTRTVRDLNRLMEKRTGELLFVLEDQRKPLEKLFTANPAFKKKFTSKLELPVFINDELVTFGQTYAKENGYKLDEMGILALYSRIDVMQREDHAVTVAEVKEIMDDAIEHSRKANVKHFARRVFGKGTDDRDRIILKEDDFRI